jgi:pescadillo
MLTFLEFYQTFVSFINYRLYTSINLVYPPKLDIEKDESGAGLSAYLIQSITDQPSAPAIQEKQIESNQPIKDTTKQLATLSSKLASLTSTIDPSAEPEIPTPSPEDDTLDTFTSADPTTTLPQPTLLTSNSLTTLFHGLHIYLSRETPVDSLTFLLFSFSVSSLSTDPTCGPHPYTDLDPRITHQICDRGRLPATIVPGRKYVQPQWIVDSINRGELLSETEYVPGTELPPHLSPFVEKREGAYDPEEAVEVSSEEEDVDLEDGDEEVVDEESEQQRLLVAEARGEKVVERPVKGKKGKKTRGRDAEEGEGDAKEMAKIMMSNKNRRLLEAMEFGNRKRKGEADKLAGRKRELIREERKRKKVKLG